MVGKKWLFDRNRRYAEGQRAKKTEGRRVPGDHRGSKGSESRENTWGPAAQASGCENE